MNRFSTSRQIIEQVMSQLKAHHNIHPNAQFDFEAEDNLRSQVSYRDEDFLWFLGNTDHEEHITSELLSYLSNEGIVSNDGVYDVEAFANYRKLIRKHFRGSWTSFTPVMERVVYLLTALKKPRRLVEIGCFWGNTLAWFAGPALSPYRVYQAEEIIGIDRDSEMMNLARENFLHIDQSGVLKLQTGDGKELIDEVTDPIDFLYIEAKNEEEPDLYLTLLKKVYDRLPAGSWVIAHDIYDKDAIDEMAPYVNWVRDPSHFSTSVAIDVDFCGLELSVK